MNELELNQGIAFTVKRSPVKCSNCGELRTQDTRCENCGHDIPYFEEKKNDQKTSS